MFKRLLQMKLEAYVRRYFKTHADVKLVVVTGSVGKTSTKIAIGTVLAERFRIRLHEGNHNADLSAPLAILGVKYPDNIRSISAWRTVFRAAKQRIAEPSDVDVIVQEVGSDRIGQVPHIRRYLRPDIAVVTAVSPEHMEYFGTIDAVAAEELSVVNFSGMALINRDDIDGRFSKLITNPNISTYGSDDAAEYYFVQKSFGIKSGFEGTFVAKEWESPVATSLRLLGAHSIRPAVAAGAVAVKLGMSADEIATGMQKIRAVNGRMNVLRGQENTVIIDDTYNSSPLAAASALRALYALDAPQKIAVLGSMNELGESAVVEHEALGAECDANQLAWVVTVGDLAEQYLAPVARQQGCQVRSFANAIEAGTFVHSVMEPGAVILFKGSEGKIYLEEAVKIVLRSTSDEKRLVRQSEAWLERKSAFFAKN